ncbi:MAG: EF2563 family selenium-dependent molybdenum hydroxylase system protein [Oscillibacter sp.]|nr:EF2563 family selenium-dependent molybdenum hydroxylase system protein [Oscillibacter sp.]
MPIVIRGAGDIASGIALRLFRAGYRVVMLDLPQPTAIRRTVCFSEAIRNGKATVEDVTAIRAETPAAALAATREGKIAVMADGAGKTIPALAPAALVDAILAKKNLGTKITDAPVVIGVGPGFTAGEDCHAAVETKRGHTLGRALYEGAPLPNTGVPGVIGGYGAERVLRAPADGVFSPRMEIGRLVTAGETAATVGGVPMLCTIDGCLRGLLQAGLTVKKGMKCGDIDPRACVENCFTASDKALAVGGGVLEALMRFGVLPNKEE